MTTTMTQFMSFEGPTFTMEVPTNWVISSSAQFQAIFLGPADQPLRPNLIVSIYAVEPDVTPDSVADNARQSQTAEYQDYEILSEVNFREFGGLGVMRRYRWFNPSSNLPVVQMQAYFIHQQMLHTLTATRADTLPAETAQWIDDTFDQMLQSFRFRL